jgi:hypothetical protein
LKGIIGSGQNRSDTMSDGHVDVLNAMGGLTLECPDDDDLIATLVQRRYLATFAAIEAAERECRVLHDVIALAKESCESTRERLAELKLLRDSLGEQLLQPDLRLTPARACRTPTFFAATSAVCDVRHETLRRSGYG